MASFVDIFLAVASPNDQRALSKRTPKSESSSQLFSPRRPILQVPCEIWLLTFLFVDPEFLHNLTTVCRLWTKLIFSKGFLLQVRPLIQDCFKVTLLGPPRNDWIASPEKWQNRFAMGNQSKKFQLNVAEADHPHLAEQISTFVQENWFGVEEEGNPAHLEFHVFLRGVFYRVEWSLPLPEPQSVRVFHGWSNLFISYADTDLSEFGRLRMHLPVVSLAEISASSRAFKDRKTGVLYNEEPFFIRFAEQRQDSKSMEVGVHYFEEQKTENENEEEEKPLQQEEHEVHEMQEVIMHEIMEEFIPVAFPEENVNSSSEEVEDVIIPMPIDPPPDDSSELVTPPPTIGSIQSITLFWFDKANNKLETSNSEDFLLTILGAPLYPKYDSIYIQRLIELQDSQISWFYVVFTSFFLALFTFIIHSFLHVFLFIIGIIRFIIETQSCGFFLVFVLSFPFLCFGLPFFSFYTMFERSYKFGVLGAIEYSWDQYFLNMQGLFSALDETNLDEIED